MTSFTFGKKYKLCSKILISSLFESGTSIRVFPFNCWYRELSSDEYKIEKPFQIAIAVPKKKFKSAVARNRIKRQIREGVRLNKASLEKTLIECDKTLILFLIYTNDKEEKSSSIHKKIAKLFAKLGAEIDKGSSTVNQLI